jgi:hypothetical protein
MTFEKRKNTKKYKSGERARRMPPALNGEKRRIFLLSLSVFDDTEIGAFQSIEIYLPRPFAATSSRRES